MDRLPLNLNLMSNPLNWFIVTLMVIIGHMAINEVLKLLHGGMTVPGMPTPDALLPGQH